MQNEEVKEFTPVTEEVAGVLKEHQVSAKLIFRKGEIVEVKGCKMRVLQVYRRSITLRPIGWSK